MFLTASISTQKFCTELFSCPSLLGNAAKNIKQFGLIKTGIPTDSGELTPVDRSIDTLIFLAREGIGQVHWLKQEAHAL